ncbi:uncharacterized protein HD556DRAFT_1230584 [Suillus plorans]|uniref:Uncharacterized protein n=1 Tax=Suillus plorans TaxID=116603 RepID=A0A9P7DQ58_9AGAM|nr:uncharacterized protein HD556DRAFT_1230584 [Suillus plorans]KAG1800395.1 hypothetical protein HD556DRAFT_1230584 [Suillus plorans]
MDPSEISPEYELTVRNHIRQTFLPYVRKYITRDHVAYTESKLEQIFTESLDFVPLADPHVLVLPPDPLDTLVRSLKDLDFSFDERLTTDGDTVRKIKSSLKTIVGEGRELRSEACWREEDYMYTCIAEIYRPMTPILTNRARKQTPKAGSNVLRASLPRTQPALFEHIGVKSVVVAQIEDSDVPNLEEVLNVRPTMESTTRTYILSLFKSANPPAQLTETNVHVASFLRADSPPFQIQRPLSPPLFSRSQASPGSLWTGIANAKDIVGRLNAAPVPVQEELEDNVDSVNMSIVDGWAVLPISSPPSASPLSSQGTEIDELWEASPTPPGTPATSLFSARMDEVEIPRIHKPGHILPHSLKPRGSNRCVLQSIHERSLTRFLQSQDGRILDAEDSMLGQPPSVCTASPLPAHAGRDRRKKSDQDQALEDIDVEQGLDMALRHIYQAVQQENIEGCVLQERLDEKDVALMDVPHLPSPTVHLGPSLQPTSMRALIHRGKMNTNVQRHTTLEPVKGIKPLNLELSWRPFKFAAPIPTDESVSLVAESTLDDLVKLGYADKASETKIHGLLADLETTSCHSANVAESKKLKDKRGTGSLGLSPPRPPKSSMLGEGFELVLTKRERRLHAGLPEFEDFHEHRAKYGENCHKRQDKVKGGDETSLETDNEDQPAKPPRFVFHDSGILDNQDDPSPLEAVYSLDGADYSDKDEEDNPRYVCQHQGQGQDRDQGHEGLSSSFPLLARHRYGPSPYPASPPLRGLDQDYAMANYSQDKYMESAFFPLSFGSQGERVSRCPADLVAISGGDEERSVLPDTDSPKKTAGISDNDQPANITSFLRYFGPEMDPSTAFPAFKRRRLDDPMAAAVVTRGFLDDYLALRNKNGMRDPPPSVTPTIISSEPQGLQLGSISPPRAAPVEILDTYTMLLPDVWNAPTANHCYLASMALIQKRALVRALQAPECRVHLVERYVLGGVDIAMDPDTAVLVAPLLALPSQVEGLVDRISQASWRYTRILIILEAFPSANAFTAEISTNNVKLMPYAFSPPILKAVKKLRRLLTIAEGCGTKNAECKIQWAFANDVGEVALFVRIFGNLAQEWAFNGGGNALWEDRAWLQVEEHEDEADLASVEGMNPFAAFVMLHQGALQEILDMTPESRVAEFSYLVGSQRIVRCSICSGVRKFIADFSRLL